MTNQRKKKRFRPLTIGGLRFTLDPLLPVVMVMLAWLLSERYYPQLIDFEPVRVYWILGITSTLMLIFSIVVHELGHALAASKLNVPIERIHLFLFGGMAELRHRPLRPSDEMIIALAGPAASLVLALLLWPVMEVLKPGFFLEYHLVQFILYVNLLLALFNMIPVYPLDGGRSLRAVIWWLTGNYYRSSVTMYKTGAAVIGLVFLAGLFDYVALNHGWAVWLALLALYLAYTAYSGRNELIQLPGLQDLVLLVDPDQDTARIVEMLRAREDRFLQRSIVPVMQDGRMVAVIYGRDLAATVAEYGQWYREPQAGDYIDISEPDGYLSDQPYHADYIPVLFSGVLKGIGNANEIRFWLREHHRNNETFHIF